MSLDTIQIGADTAARKDLKLTEKVILEHLRTLCSTREVRADDGFCEISIDTLAATWGVGKTAAKEAVKSLEVRGLVVVEHGERRAGSARNDCNRYFVEPRARTKKSKTIKQAKAGAAAQTQALEAVHAQLRRVGFDDTAIRDALSTLR